MRNGVRTGTVGARYALFAVCATALNMGLQYLIMEIVRRPVSIYLAMVVGTAAGIVLKYSLDCRYIFFYVKRPVAENAVTFALYVVMSGLTTAIFWGAELAAAAISTSDCAAYFGGIFGLGLGYAVKYRLDKHFVFARRTS